MASNMTSDSYIQRMEKAVLNASIAMKTMKEENDVLKARIKELELLLQSKSKIPSKVKVSDVNLLSDNSINPKLSQSEDFTRNDRNSLSKMKKIDSISIITSKSSILSTKSNMQIDSTKHMTRVVDTFNDSLTTNDISESNQTIDNESLEIDNTKKKSKTKMKIIRFEESVMKSDQILDLQTKVRIQGKLVYCLIYLHIT